MLRKKLVLYLSALICVSFLCTGCLLKKNKPAIKEESVLIQRQEQKAVVKPKLEIKKHDLYSTTPYDLPLFSIVKISELPTALKSKIDKILEASQGFYLLYSNNERVLIILQNPVTNMETFHRHDLQFVEIDLEGKVVYHNAGYTGISGEVSESLEQEYENWLFDEKSEFKRPVKHIVYDEKEKIKFIESWNYDEKEPIKYQMLGSNKKVVSILKEIQESESNYRKEHIFYDNEGNIKMSLTINYDGANISRLTFYNSHDSIDSMSIISEFENGFKTKELIYNENYQLMNTVIAEYENDERKSIKVYDFEGKEVDKLSS